MDLSTRQGLYILPFFALVGLLISVKHFLLGPSREAEAPTVILQSGRQNGKKNEEAQPDAENEKERRELLSLAPLALLSAYAFYMVVFHSLSNLPLVELFYGVVARFWMQPNIIVFIWVGVAIEWLFERAHAVTSGRLKLRQAIVNTMYAACVALVVAQLWRNYKHVDQSHSRYFSQYARSLLEPLPRGAILLLSYDMQWTSVRYTQVG